MKLAYSPASPYVRKVTACAIKRGIDKQIERMKISTTDPELLKYNALSKVPTLITDDGAYLFDSPVICEYLDSHRRAPKLFPAPGPARWKALTQEALADGILDATQPRRRELTLPQDDGRKSYIALQQGKVARARRVREAGDLARQPDTIGEITIGCALGYLDFRYANEPWRPGHPELDRVVREGCEPGAARRDDASGLTWRTEGRNDAGTPRRGMPGGSPRCARGLGRRRAGDRRRRPSEAPRRATALAEVFDLQHQAARHLPDARSRRPASRSRQPHDSALEGRSRKRARHLRQVAEFTVGLMGRTPDYMNVTFAGFAGRADEWAINGNERGAGNLVAYQKFLARRDISLTHTIVQPTIDKSCGDAPSPGNDVALHKVADTEHGIVVRGARILATLAPFADEIAVYPAVPLPEGADAYALSFCIPMSTPGLKFLCRDSCLDQSATVSTIRCRAASTSRTRS